MFRNLRSATAIAAGLLVSALAIGGLLRADGESRAIRSGAAGGPGERGRVTSSEAEQAEQVPVQVLVWKESVGENVRYHYSIENGSAFRIATLLVGYNESRLEPQLRKVPAGWTDEDAAPSGSTAPSGWEITVVSVEMDTVVSVRWAATLDGAKIPGGGTLSGFSVVAPPGDPEYDFGGHWVVYLDSAEKSHYAGLLKRQGTTSAQPANIDVHGGAHVTPKVDSSTVRQLPSAFPKLPASIRRDLEKRGFLVPQPYGRRQANVVRGQFERRGQHDWAVLCSKDGVSRILIFWGGSTARVDSLAFAADEEFMQGVESGQMGYSRAITAVAPAVMRGFYEEWDRGKPPMPLTHDGVDDAFVGKFSVVHYWHQGRWLELAGGD